MRFLRDLAHGLMAPMDAQLCTGVPTQEPKSASVWAIDGVIIVRPDSA